jgi:hypothetical protein
MGPVVAFPASGAEAADGRSFEQANADTRRRARSQDLLIIECFRRSYTRKSKGETRPVGSLLCECLSWNPWAAVAVARRQIRIR